MPGNNYRIRIRKGDAEFEVQGDIEFVEKKSKEFRALVTGTETATPAKTTGTAPHAGPPVAGSPRPGHGIPSTWSAKFKTLMDDGFFTDPKQPAQVRDEFRTRVWGMYKTKQVSSQLIYYAPRIGLRRISLGEGKVGYVHP